MNLCKAICLGVLSVLLSQVCFAKAKYPPPPPQGAPITVTDTVYGVLRSHRAIRGMQENRIALEHEVSKAKAGFGPQVNVTGEGGGSLLSDSSTREKNLDRQMYGMVSASARLVQPIWDGFATRSRVRTAKSVLESVNHRLFDTATSLSLDGIIAQINLNSRRVIHDYAEANVKQHENILAQTRSRMAFGADTAADESQAKTRLARAMSSLAEAKANLLTAEDTYARLTGMGPAKNMAKVELPPIVYDSPSAVLKFAETSNPKLKAYTSDIKAARGELELADSAFYPQLSVEAGPSYSNRGGDDNRWSYGVDAVGVVRWNIFNSGADVAEKKAQSARVRQARQVMYDFADDLKLDIDSTWVAYKSAMEQKKYYDEAITAAKFTKGAYLEQFHLGERSLLDVLDAENELYSSQVQAELAASNILIGAYRLCALTGDLLSILNIDTVPLFEVPKSVKIAKSEEFASGWFD